MAIPLRYNLRSLRVRWHSTLATMLGIALVVLVFILVRALAHGIESTYINTGDERNLIVMRNSCGQPDTQFMTVYLQRG